jgi:hypothetical protein
MFDEHKGVAVYAIKKNVLFNCRWPIKIAIKIRAFFEKMAGVHLKRNFATLRSFF